MGEQKKLPSKISMVFDFGIIALAGIGIFVLLKMENTTIIENAPFYEPPPKEEVTDIPELVAPPLNPKLRVLDNSLGYLNVRNAPSLKGTTLVGKVKPRELYEYTQEKDGWYYILIPEKEGGWVFGEYIEKTDR